AMGKDLENLEDLVQLRGEGGDNAIVGRERFLSAEEFPILVDECDHAANWIKRHAKRGRRYKQFVCALAQNDTAENFGLQGDKDTLYSCFCLVRLGQFGCTHA
ncbi:MAG: ATP-binding protein, partial [Nostoc sp.]